MNQLDEQKITAGLPVKVMSAISEESLGCNTETESLAEHREAQRLEVSVKGERWHVIEKSRDYDKRDGIAKR